jgi:peptidoglycan/LPS O-acetylase OafA/YrhL
VKDSQKNYFPALTGLRALAAFMVFFHHVNPFRDEGQFKLLYSFTHELYIGVSLFFVLSGFLIYWRYADLLIQNKGWFASYIQNRLSRIYPLYFLLSTFTFIVLWKTDKLVFGKESVYVFLANITLLKGFFNDWKFTGLGQGWSLTVEECFYFTAPLLFIGYKRLKFVLPFIILGIGFGFVFLFRHMNFYGLFSDFHFMMMYTFFGRCFEFFVGISLARYLKNEREPRQTSLITYAGLLGILTVVFILSLLKGDAASGIDHPIGILVNNFALPVITALLIYGLVREKTWVQKILASELFEILGKSSYAFYLLHAGIFFSAIYHYITTDTFLIFLTLNALSIICYYLVEKPLHEKWRSKVLF